MDKNDTLFICLLTGCIFMAGFVLGSYLTNNHWRFILPTQMQQLCSECIAADKETRAP